MVLAVVLVLGLVAGVIDRTRFNPAWLLVSLLLVAMNDSMLTSVYGLLPDQFAAASWNWQGKVLALAATLAVAALPSFGWRRCGITLRQAHGSIVSALPVAAAYIAFFAVIALMFPGDDPTAEDVAFQLTMPGFEEEPFYRGILLYAMDRAYTGRVRWLSVDWGVGAVLSCLVFGLAHALAYSDGQFSFDSMTMTLTAIPAFLGVWLRIRTGSLLMPVVLHNLGNSASLVL